MRLKGFFLLLSGALFGSLLGVTILLSSPIISESQVSRDLPPTIGSPVVDFQLISLDGKEFRTGDFRGKPYILNFWATWCAPCKEEMPLLMDYAQDNLDKFVVIGINSGENRDVVQEFVDEQEINFLILLDQSRSVSKKFYVNNFPTTFFVDKDGILRAHHIGMLSDEIINKYLDLIGESE